MAMVISLAANGHHSSSSLWDWRQTRQVIANFSFSFSRSLMSGQFRGGGNCVNFLFIFDFLQSWLFFSRSFTFFMVRLKTFLFFPPILLSDFLPALAFGHIKSLHTKQVMNLKRLAASPSSRVKVTPHCQVILAVCGCRQGHYKVLTSSGRPDSWWLTPASCWHRLGLPISWM